MRKRELKQTAGQNNTHKIPVRPSDWACWSHRHPIRQPLVCLWPVHVSQLSQVNAPPSAQNRGQGHPGVPRHPGRCRSFPGVQHLVPAVRQPPAHGAVGERGIPGRKALTSARFSCILSNTVFKGGEGKGAGVIVTAYAACQAARMLPKTMESLRCLLKTLGIMRCKRTSPVQR